MDLTVVNVKIDEIHIRSLNGHPELILYITLLNRKNRKIGQVTMSTERYHTETQYKLPEDIRVVINDFIGKLNVDVLENYITYDCSSR